MKDRTKQKGGRIMTPQTRAIRFSTFGGPGVLSVQPIDLLAPAEGKIRIRYRAVGFNFIDIYHRKGVIGAPLPLPSGLGVEGVGEITAMGAGVGGFAPGDRVAYVGGPPGAYAEVRNLPAGPPPPCRTGSTTSTSRRRSSRA